jgi:hypothetical protein
MPKVNNNLLGENSTNLGPMLWFLNIFAEKIAKKLAVLTHNKAELCKIFDHNIGFWENANFFSENWQKSQKFVIITSTPGRPVSKKNLFSRWQASVSEIVKIETYFLIINRIVQICFLPFYSGANTTTAELRNNHNTGIVVG